MGASRPTPGCELCPACGKNVRKNRGKPHKGTAECVVRVTIQNYAKRGWIMCENVTQASILEDAGGTIEHAPGRIGLMVDAVRRSKNVKGETINEIVDELVKDEKGRYIEIPEDRPYAPKVQVRAYQIIAGVTFERGRRREVLNMLLADSELCEAARSVRQLSGSSEVREFLQRVHRERGLGWQFIPR